MVDAGDLGRKTGQGFYTYDALSQRRDHASAATHYRHTGSSAVEAVRHPRLRGEAVASHSCHRRRRVQLLRGSQSVLTC